MVDLGPKFKSKMVHAPLDPYRYLSLIEVLEIYNGAVKENNQ